MKLLFATTNQGKFTEAKQLLAESPLQLFSLNDFQELHNVVVKESGETFAANAFLKAQAYGKLAKILTFAEDSGLLVDALDGQPGVYSARFGLNTTLRNQKLLAMMKEQKNKTARFVSVFCLYDPITKKANYFSGEIEGEIALAARGSNGFGYDPLFIPDGFHQTFAELGKKIKNKISHRQRAMEKLRAMLL